MKLRIIGSLAIAAVSMLILGSCGSDPDSPGLEYMPDMYRSPAIEPNVDYGHIKEREKPELKSRLSAMTPPNGTIPFYGTDSAEVALMLPYKHKANAEFKESHGMYGEELSPKSINTYELAKDDKNPLALPAESDSVAYKAFWKNAEKLFVANCAHCHGEKGDGNGPMMVNETYVGVPNYADVAATEGQMFYSIYYGKGAMGSHRSLINKKEIWTLVHYIQRLINKDYGTSKMDEEATTDEEGTDEEMTDEDGETESPE
ncbi:MAG: c-type cytochrome [bacterium]|nr:c-type cytochrome [bacterium]